MENITDRKNNLFTGVKKILFSAWNEFVFGSHLLSLGAGAGILFSTFFVLEKEINIILLILSYLALQIIYNFDHLRDSKKKEDGNLERSNYLKENRNKILVLLYILLLIGFSFMMGIETLLFFILFVLGGLMYTIKLKGLTKKILMFKNLYVSFFIAVLPFSILLHYSVESIKPIILFSLFIFLRFVLSTAYFDIKDIEEDKKKGLKTLPALLGRKKTIKTLHLLDVLSFFPIFIGVYMGVFPKISLSLLLLFFYSFYYLRKTIKSDDNDVRFLSYIMVDGEYLFWPAILIIANFLL